MASTIASSGRAPWYTSSGEPLPCYIIGIAGGSASGKTTVAERIIKNLNVPWISLLSMDSFYKALTEEQRARALDNNYDFDAPTAFDYDILEDCLRDLKQGRCVKVPVYDFTTHSRLSKTTTVYGANVIIFEGIFALYDKKVMDLMDMKIFVDTDSDLRLARRLKRDIMERGRDFEGVLQQYTRFVKPSYDNFIHPTVRNADVIIPRGSDNLVAIDLITKHIQRELSDRQMHFRSQLANVDVSVAADSSHCDEVITLEPTPQIRGMHTIIRDRTTPRGEFIFYTERLATLVIERALSLLPYAPKEIYTPTTSKTPFYGSQLACGLHPPVAVSIMRSGGVMERSLRRVMKDVIIGKILIQSDKSQDGGGEPRLHYLKLPPQLTGEEDEDDRQLGHSTIAKSATSSAMSSESSLRPYKLSPVPPKSPFLQARPYVLLLDAQLGTGASALMSIRILLDHHVPPSNIIFCCLLSAPQGILVIRRAFPQVRIVTSWQEEGLIEYGNGVWACSPGAGQMSDRYFGTEEGEEEARLALAQE